METKKSSFKESWNIYFGLGALMFGTYCGANMASGVYATTYIITLGGGWAIPVLLMFIAFMTIFPAIGLDFARSFKARDYNGYYLALYGLHKPDSNKVLKAIVTVFFDIYTTLFGLVTVGSCVALFASLMNQLLNVPTAIASAGGVLLFGFVTFYGAAFLRKFNKLMTYGLVASLAAILISVIVIKGDVLAERIGNFNIGPDWGFATPKAHFAMFFSYCLTTSSWGSSLSAHSDILRSKKDAYISGLFIALLVTVLFAVTGAIVLPFMPEAYGGTPILYICQNYLNPVLTIVYWLVVILSVISTAPTFTFNVGNRWQYVWKSEKVSQNTKIFVIGMVFLLLCWAISGMGLMAVCQKGYTMLGDIALYAVVIPLLISIPRVIKNDKANKEG